MNDLPSPCGRALPLPVAIALNLVRIFGLIVLTLYLFHALAFLVTYRGHLLGAERQSLKIIQEWMLSWR